MKIGWPEGQARKAPVSQLLIKVVNLVFFGYNWKLNIFNKNGSTYKICLWIKENYQLYSKMIPLWQLTYPTQKTFKTRIKKLFYQKQINIVNSFKCEILIIS